MFSKPVTRDGWLNIPAVKNNGAVVDLFTGGPFEGTKRPDSLSSRFEKDRWRKIWQNLMGSHKGHMLGLGRYLCRRSGSNADPGQRVEAFEVILIREDIKPRGERGSPMKVLLWRHECIKGMVQKWKTTLPFESLPLPTLAPQPPSKSEPAPKPGTPAAAGNKG